MPKVKELLMDAVQYDLYPLAYSVFIAVQDGIVMMEDEQEEFFSSNLPYEKIYQELENDSLFLIKNSVKFYMIKHHGYYAMYLSKSWEEAEQLHLKLFNMYPERIVDATQKKGSFIFDSYTKKTYNFYELQKRIASLPHYCGLIERKVKQ